MIKTVEKNNIIADFQRGLGNKTIAKTHGHSRTTIIKFRKAYNEAIASDNPDAALTELIRRERIPSKRNRKHPKLTEAIRDIIDADLDVTPESFTAQASRENWSYDKLVATLLGRESEHRGELRRKAQVHRAGFLQLLYLENLKRNELPKDMAVALPELKTLDFIKEGQNVIMYGNPGTGKTHCAIGLGIKACLAGYTVLYTSIPHLLTEIRECES